MKSYLLFSLCLCACSCFAQKQDSLAMRNQKIANEVARTDIVAENSYAFNSKGDYQRYITPFDTRYEGLKGTHYFIPKWLKGDLYGVSGKLVATEVPIKYDVFNKEVVMQKSATDTVAVYPSAFTIYGDNDVAYKFIKYPAMTSQKGVNIPNDYLQILYDNKVLFVRHINKIFLGADYKGLYSANRTYDSFQDKSEYFLIKSNGDIEKIQLKKASVLKALADQKQKVEDYIRSHKLKMKTDAEVVEVLQYYASLR